MDFDTSAILAKSKKLRIVTMAMGEMGHLFPIIRVTVALEKAGHEVLALFTNSYAKESAEKAVTHHGIKAPLICPDSFTKFQYWRGIDTPDVPRPPNGDNYCDERVVKVFKEKVQELKPDIIVADFSSQFPHSVADQLEIPLVINCPSPLKLMNLGWLSGLAVEP